MTSFELVLSLLRSSLWGEDTLDVEWSDGRWEEVYEIACDQGVQTLLIDAFHPGCVPPKPLLARWVVDVDRTEAMFARMRSAVEELSDMWEKAGVGFAVLKGVSMAALYPCPEHRLSGDIDFYFPGTDAWEKARQIAGKMADTGIDSDGDVHYMWKGIVVEHHRLWNHLSSRKASGIPARITDHVLCPEDMLLMLSAHILRHAMVGGAGVRQLADLAVATRACAGKYDKAAFARRLSALGLEKWAALIASVMCSRFGVPEEELPVSPDPKHRDDFMNLVCRDGNLGRENESLLSGFFPRMALFLRLCPAELLSRWLSLAGGRLRKALKIGKK